MIKIIERKNGSCIFIGFYSKDLDKDEVAVFAESIQKLCVDSHNDRAIAVPDGTDVKSILQGKE